MATTPPGWYDDGTGTTRWWDGSTWTDNVQPPAPSVTAQNAPQPSGGIEKMVDDIKAQSVAGAQPHANVHGAKYVVLQVVLKEQLWGSGSGNLTELEGTLNAQAALGYRLHTISTSSSGSKGMLGGDRIQATMVFEKIE